MTPASTARQHTGDSASPGLWSWPGRFADILREHALIVAILAGGFVTRFVLADWNSYWLDELYSVAIYGVWNDSLADMVRNLAETSVHPPLYQGMLFLWMDWLGDSEVVTRTLSNIFITGATFFLYMLLWPIYGRMIGLVGAAGFTAMYSAVYFGLEARSYALTMFLVAISSYCLLHLNKQRSDGRKWLRIMRSVPFASLVAANTCLLLTHYYNSFFLAAQGLLCVVFILREVPPRKWLASAGVLGMVYGVPLIVFVLTWGDQALATYRAAAGGFSVDDGAEFLGFRDLITTGVLAENLYLPRYALIAIAVLVMSVVIAAVVAVIGRSGGDRRRRKDWTTVYLFGWLVLPLIVVVVVFYTIGAARYSDRYFLFSAVPLVPLIAVALTCSWTWISERFRLRSGPRAKWMIGGLLMVVVVLAIWPGTVQAARSRKDDWRGTADTIVSIVESDPVSRFVIFDTSFRQVSVLDYYLERMSDEIRVSTTIRRGQERSGGPFSFETHAELLAGSDFLIVPFIHHRSDDFPLALERLEEIYDLHLWQINRNGRGIVIFRTS